MKATREAVRTVRCPDCDAYSGTSCVIYGPDKTGTIRYLGDRKQNHKGRVAKWRAEHGTEGTG